VRSATGAYPRSGAFYILVSARGQSIIPPRLLPLEMAPYLALVGEFRVHYAGFFRSRLRPRTRRGHRRARRAGSALFMRPPFVLEHAARSSGAYSIEHMSCAARAPLRRRTGRFELPRPRPECPSISRHERPPRASVRPVFLVGGGPRSRGPIAMLLSPLGPQLVGQGPRRRPTEVLRASQSYGWRPCLARHICATNSDGSAWIGHSVAALSWRLPPGSFGSPCP